MRGGHHSNYVVELILGLDLRESPCLNPVQSALTARMLSPSPTGVGNYIAALLHPLCEAHPRTRFFLLSSDIRNWPPDDTRN
jgi:hypothetical protein